MGGRSARSMSSTTTVVRRWALRVREYAPQHAEAAAVVHPAAAAAEAASPVGEPTNSII